MGEGRRWGLGSRYRIRGRLGQGDGGSLFVAQRAGVEGFSKVVALAQLPRGVGRGVGRDQRWASMFLDEARVAASLEHPNLVATYDAGCDETAWKCMEYLPGEKLGTLLARSRSSALAMPVEVAANIVQQCALGLHHAHGVPESPGSAATLVHQQLGPHNVLVTYYGVAKVLNTGLAATQRRHGSQHLEPQWGCGHLAPEQLAGGAADKRTDVFALGVIFWECLTGAPLFTRATAAATMEAVQFRAIPPPSTIRADLPSALDPLVLRALERDPDRRFGSALELSQALLAFLENWHPPHRPMHVGVWLQELFGKERMSHKKNIADGVNLELALEKLYGRAAPGGPALRPKEKLGMATLPTPVSFAGRVGGWTWGRRRGAASAVRPTPTGVRAAAEPSVFTGETGDGAAAPRRQPAVATAPRRIGSPTRLVGGVLAGLALGSVVLAGVLLLGPSELPGVHRSRARFGALLIDSDPPGAHVFVDGNPIGSKTPLVIEGLRAGGEVHISVALPGYKPDSARLLVLEGEQREVFALEAAGGSVELRNLPRHAQIYVDDQLVRATEQLFLPIGVRALRIEEGGDLIYAGTVKVVPGVQTVEVPNPRGRKRQGTRR